MHPDRAVQVYTPDKLNKLMGISDYVVMALPYTQSTHQLVNAEAINAMRPNGVLINVGRGKTLEQDAVVKGEYFPYVRYDVLQKMRSALRNCGSWSPVQACQSNKAAGCKYLLLNILGYVVKGSFLLDAALQEKRIRGAALDVFETEPLPEDSPLYELDNCLLSPHCADRTARSVLSYSLTIPTLQDETAHHNYVLLDNI